MKQREALFSATEPLGSSHRNPPLAGSVGPKLFMEFLAEMRPYNRGFLYVDFNASGASKSSNPPSVG